MLSCSSSEGLLLVWVVRQSTSALPLCPQQTRLLSYIRGGMDHMDACPAFNIKLLMIYTEILVAFSRGGCADMQ